MTDDIFSYMSEDMVGGHWAGTLIRLARMQKGLTQREVAERAGTSQSAIAAYERGHKSPNFDTLVRIIQAMGLDLKFRLTEPVPEEEARERLQSRQRKDRRARARAAVGSYRSPEPTNYAEEHDDYLAEAFAE